MSADKVLRREWQEPTPVEASESLRAAVGGHPLVAEHLTRKGIVNAAAAQRFMSAAAYAPTPADELPDIEPAVERLRRAIRDQERILIWGDFDVDGQTATALLFSALKQRGARVAYHVPNRFSEGHGIHLPALKRKLSGGVELLLTCDTGVSAHEAVDCAAGRGVDCIITDHHSLPERLPAALAVVNPQRLPAGHALRELPGVGVAYKLIEALAAHDDGDPDEGLDLVALGIVADVMVQVDDTRYLLQRGLERLRRNERPGLRAILENAQIAAPELNEGHIGFAIAPRLNALGRLDDANPAVALLTTAAWDQARLLAHRLESYNARRKFLSNQVYESAIAQIEAEPWLLDYAALVLSHSDWHSGVIGIVASRLVEEFGRPTVLIATPDETGRGSARSLAGLDITAAFGRVAAQLTRYGGHSMAAGMSLPAERIFQFRRALSGVLREMGGAEPSAPALDVDGYLQLPELSLELAEDIERLAPFGNGNPPLTLATRDLRLASRKGLGRRGEHLQVEVEDEAGNRQRVIWWRGAGKDLPSGKFDLAYTLRSSMFKGQREALIEWLDYRQLESALPEIKDDEPAWELQDYRGSDDLQSALAGAREWYPQAQIWAEAATERMAGAVNRLGLRAGETLIVWTVPPSAETWSAALATVSPGRLILFGALPDCADLSSFLQRLAGLVKFSINQRGGAVGLEALAAATAQPERTAQVGLQVLRALGKLDYQVGASGEYRLRAVENPPSGELGVLRNRLDLLLRETRAYRKYWLNMEMRG